jgi:hypothetical protein
MNKSEVDSSWVFLYVDELVSELFNGKSDFEKLKFVILPFFAVIVSPSNRTNTAIFSIFLNIPFFA